MHFHFILWPSIDEVHICYTMIWTRFVSSYIMSWLVDTDHYLFFHDVSSTSVPVLHSADLYFPVLYSTDLSLSLVRMCFGQCEQHCDLPSFVVPLCCMQNFPPFCHLKADCTLLTVVLPLRHCCKFGGNFLAVSKWLQLISMSCC